MSTSDAKLHSVNHNVIDSVQFHDEREHHLSLTAHGPSLSPFHPTNQIGPSGFHTLPSQQSFRAHQPPPSNYYFGCHPSQNVQKNTGLACGVEQSPHFLLGMRPSTTACIAPQYFELSGSISNEELDKSEDLIYESIYDSRWRLLNQVGVNYLGFS